VNEKGAPEKRDSFLLVMQNAKLDYMGNGRMEVKIANKGIVFVLSLIG
jgi:hypothetical protein